MSATQQLRRRKIAGERRSPADRIARPGPPDGDETRVRAPERAEHPDGSSERQTPPPTHPAARAASQERTPRSAPSWLLAALATLLVAAVVFDVVVFLKQGNEQTTEGAKTAAVQAAFTDAPARADKAATSILSYDYQTLDQDAAAATTYMTPEAAQQYRDTFENVVKEPAVDVKARVTAKVMVSGVASVDDSTTQRVDVLMFIDQTSVTIKHKEPQTSLNRVVFTMAKSGDTWLVDKITAL